MIPELREKFNSEFSEDKHRRFELLLESAVGVKPDFRPCETPVFLPIDLLDTMQRAASEIIAQLCTPDYFAASNRAIPPEFNTPNEGAHPQFVQVDFAVTRNVDGRLSPRLIELQGCASLYAFQFLLPQLYQQVYELGSLRFLLSGLSHEGYLELLRRVVLGGYTPEEVILMEIDPLHQKTRPDFLVTEQLLGVTTVDVRDLIKRGKRLLYKRDGREVEIRRIYNRVIIDEFVRRGVQASFNFGDELEVEWAGHPNWYFRMSKFSLPFLKHETAPRAWFLDQVVEYPEDLESFVLKPLFSFAGTGVKVNITRQDLDRVPADERSGYLLQEKVVYAPVIETPDEPSKVEIRVMYLWPDDENEPIAVTTLTRLSKGVMMGVDFNKNKTWVGSSCSLFP
jgi:hypothetical protein